MSYNKKNVADMKAAMLVDFADAIWLQLEKRGMKKEVLADILGINPEQVSRMLHNPLKLSVYNIAKLAVALGLKVTLLTYEDDDPDHLAGAIHPEVFRTSWEQAGKPRGSTLNKT